MERMEACRCAEKQAQHIVDLKAQVAEMELGWANSMDEFYSGELPINRRRFGREMADTYRQLAEATAQHLADALNEGSGHDCRNT